MAVARFRNNILRCKLTVRRTEPLRNSICGLRRSRIAFKRISRTNGRLLAITVYRADKQLYEHLPFRCWDLYVEMCIHQFLEGSEKSLSQKSLSISSEGIADVVVHIDIDAIRVNIFGQFLNCVFY